jgi:hypothetical protein
MEDKSTVDISINWARVRLGGLLAAAILMGFGTFIGFALEQDWAPWLQGVKGTPFAFTSGLSVWGGFSNLGFGLWAVWLYAAIRPRYGLGPKTAAGAGLATWVMIVFVTFSASAMGGTLIRFTLVSLGVSFLAVLVATVMGAWLYQEKIQELQEAVQPKKSVSVGTAPVAKMTIPERKVPASIQAPPAPPPPRPTPAATPTATVSTAPPTTTQPSATATSLPPDQTPPAKTQEDLAEKHQELQESVMALELNDEVAVREVLRTFGGGGAMTAGEVVEHLKAIQWQFGDISPRVVVTNALSNMVEQGKAKETDGKYEFSR